MRNAIKTLAADERHFLLLMTDLSIALLSSGLIALTLHLLANLFD